MTEKVSFKDAISNVELLEDLAIYDNQPCIEAQPLPLDCRANFDTNFEDRNAYITGVSKYIEEATRHAEFNSLLDKGFEHAAHLYTWRCCSRAVPMAKSNDQPNRVEINEKVVQVLEPEVDKLYNFMHFTNLAIQRFCDEVRRLCHPEKLKDFVSEAYLLTLGKTLNMFAVLDELKNMKASIKNDFSTFRRSAQFLQVMADTSTIQEMQNLSMFLATQNKIKTDLQKELCKIKGFEELLADVINICSVLFENHMYITPADRHMFVKAIAFALFLMGGEAMSKLDQRKRINIAKLDKIFQSLEVVPLFGDLQIQPFSFVTRSSMFDSSRWPNASGEGEKCHVNIAEKIHTIREHHLEYVTHLSRLSNAVAICDKDGPHSDAENNEMTQLALSGIQLLCSWTSDVVETISWKLLHPTDHRNNSDCPEDAEEYERATKYNYSAEEKGALIETISMIKSVQMMLNKLESVLNIAIRRHIYAELQDFVQITLCEMLHKAVKNKRDLLSSIIQSICDTCVDNCSGQFDSHSLEIGKKKHKQTTTVGSVNDIRVPRRCVAPSSTQLYMARTMTESLISERGGGRRLLRKEIETKHIEKLTNFLRMSFHWSSLLCFSETLSECCELSQLWFREFYLEMSMGRRIQFPIDMSIPWILTDHILKRQDPTLIECIFYQLDLYNDAAYYSLTRFRKQFLYDEVEAEVNLCFDQLVFKLSDSVFTYYKQLASSMLLDKRFKSDCQNLGKNIRLPHYVRYETLLKQRHLQLLGRSIDFNRLISQRINAAIIRALDVAISKFESEPLSSIVELDYLLEQNRLCHRLLRQNLGSISDFRDLFLEANHNVSAPYGRITLHIFYELSCDIIPNYCYNGSTHRFVLSRHLMQGSPKREKPPNASVQYFWGSLSLNAAFGSIFQMYCGFIGMAHLKPMAKLLGYQGIAVILEELIKTCQSLINGPLRKHVRSVFNLMPKVCKLPRCDYTSKGVLEYYLALLANVGKYSELKKDMCQVLRKVGNIIVFCLQLELAMSQEEMIDLLTAAPFTNVIPRPPGKKGEEEARKKKLEIKYSRIQIASVVEQLGGDEQIKIAQEGELLTKERLCCGLNIFEMFLTKIKEILLSDNIWTGGYPTNGVMWLDECVEFHRLWSALQFFYCQPPPLTSEGVEQATEPLIEAVFGDGLHWAGNTIIILLGQHRRFDILDFSYHLLRVHRTNGKDEIVKNIKLPFMVDRIRRFQLLNNQIFGVLDNYLQPAIEGNEDVVREKPVREFAPPIHQSIAQHFPSCE
uniref:Cytoplasmic FMR1-interacting protein n=1 Tax=Syphacia muris TaxID=451379 RepID=A0A0N5A899_9BILA